MSAGEVINNKYTCFLGKVLNTIPWRPQAIVIKGCNQFLEKILWLGSQESNYLLCHIEEYQFSYKQNTIQPNTLRKQLIHRICFTFKGYHAHFQQPPRQVACNTKKVSLQIGILLICNTLSSCRLTRTGARKWRGGKMAGKHERNRQ